ncbi:hypothetical protein H0H92_001023 [Tricholoma furcatifolium]|nr:hypothetical protein H0H92_001023 [Tricholoma furcatifolium]
MSIDEARATFLRSCHAKTFPGGIHSVTFQPTPGRANEDRYVVEEWDDVDQGSPWLFLAVLDGHAGFHAVDYSQQRLPLFLRDALRAILATNKYTAADIATLLRLKIEEFDHEIGAAVTSLCPNPSELDYNSTLSLLNGPDTHILRRASSGTTVSAALIDGKKENLWTVGLGDSSVVLLTDEGDSALIGKRLTAFHNTSTPSEYARIKLSHPTSEYNVLKDHRVLGVLSITRGKKIWIPFKLYLSSKHGDFPVQDVSSINVSPPYIISTSDVRHVDLNPLQGKKPALLLYTDGVNGIIEGRFLFRKEEPCGIDPAIVLGALLHEPLDEAVLRDVFEHEVESRWNVDGNRAVEVLGNILGGRDAVRMKQIMTPELLSTTGDSDLYIDDTTIIFCPLSI